MKLVVLERNFSPELSAPITFDSWMQVNHTLDGCLEARQVHWLHSLVSVNGDRSICLFHAPYTDTVRESCRQARMPFQNVWTADLWLAQDSLNLPQGASVIIAKINYDPPINQTVLDALKHQAKGCLDELNVQSIFSILAVDGSYSFCLFSASSAEQVRSLCRKFGMPFECVWKATLIKPTNEAALSKDLII